MLRLVAWIAALCFLVLAGEEISWGQRVFGFATPQILEANMQGEANLHNLNSGRFNTYVLYATFAILALAPFVRDAVAGYWYLTDTMWPGRAMFLVYAAGAGFHPGYASFVGLVIITYVVIACVHQLARNPGNARPSWTIGIIAVATSSIASFGFDDRLGENWYRIDECRELFIMFALLLHAVTVRRRVKRRAIGCG